MVLKAVRPPFHLFDQLQLLGNPAEFQSPVQNHEKSRLLKIKSSENNKATGRILV